MQQIEQQFLDSMYTPLLGLGAPASGMEKSEEFKRTETADFNLKFVTDFELLYSIHHNVDDDPSLRIEVEAEEVAVVAEAKNDTPRFATSVEIKDAER